MEDLIIKDLLRFIPFEEMEITSEWKSDARLFNDMADNYAKEKENKR